MKRLTKSQYEEIANTIYQVRKELESFEHVPSAIKDERNIAIEMVVSHLADSFKFEDTQFNYNKFWAATKYGIEMSEITD
jgi:hypothetical protein